MKNGLFILFVIALFSCEDEVQINSISGSIYVGCNNTPIASQQIALKAQATQSFSEPEIIASAYTNSSGSFQFSYELGENKKGLGDLFVVNQDGLEPLIEGLTLNSNLELNLYLNNVAEIVLNNSGSRQFSNQDTLFVGFNTGIEEYAIVNPDNGTLDTIHVQILNQFNSVQEATLFYGVGLDEYKLSREALTIEDSTLRHKSLNLTGCSQIEIVELVIN